MLSRTLVNFDLYALTVTSTHAAWVVLTSGVIQVPAWKSRADSCDDGLCLVRQVHSNEEPVHAIGEHGESGYREQGRRPVLRVPHDGDEPASTNPEQDAKEGSSHASTLAVSETHFSRVRQQH